jgi:kynureninase
LIYLVDGLLTEEPYCFRVGSPREATRRGGHVALERDRDALGICLALRGRGVVPDFRSPNIIRIAPVALYSTFHEVWQVVHHLREIIDGEEHQRYAGIWAMVP